MNRIEEKMTALKNEGRKAFITYTTAGLPDMETTKKIMFAQQEAGIDVMELGIPFSDPVADGPVIQAASYEAIQKGATLTKIFTLMKEVRKDGLTTPVVFIIQFTITDLKNLSKCVQSAEWTVLLYQTFHMRSRKRLMQCLQKMRLHQFLYSSYHRYLSSVYL